MNNEGFIEFMNCVFDEIKQLNTNKSVEYNPTDDKFSNVRASARLQNIEQSQVMGAYMAKHIISIYDMIKRGEDQIDGDKLQEKCYDVIIYLIMLMAWNDIK